MAFVDSPSYSLLERVRSCHSRISPFAKKKDPRKKNKSHHAARRGVSCSPFLASFFSSFVAAGDNDDGGVADTGVSIHRSVVNALLRWRSDFLYLLADYDRVVAADLLGTQFAVVERTLVFVRIPVHRTEQTAATTLESWKKNIRRRTILGIATHNPAELNSQSILKAVVETELADVERKKGFKSDTR